MRKLLLSCLMLALCLSVLPAAQAQDTPENVREAAIAAVQQQVPGLGRPTAWAHIFTTATDTSLGCNQVTGAALDTAVSVYVVTLTYPNTEYVVHVSGDASMVVYCSAAATIPQPGAVGQCNFGLIRIGVGSQTTVTTAQLEVRAPDISSEVVTTLGNAIPVTVIAGPVCENNRVYWQVDYGGGQQGYVVEVDYTDAANPSYFLAAAPPPGFVNPTAPANVNYTSQTCPVDDFASQGYLQPRLFVGAQGVVEGGGVPNNVRVSYGVSSQLAGELPAGTQFTVIAGPECTGANEMPIVWWQVDAPSVNLRGWTAESQSGEYYLDLLGGSSLQAPSATPAPPSPTPAPTEVTVVSTVPLLDQVPVISLPATRIPISLTNLTRLSVLGVLELPERLGTLDLGADGTLLLTVVGEGLGMGGTTLLVLDDFSAAELAPQAEKRLEVDSASLRFYRGLSPDGLRYVVLERLAQDVNAQVLLRSVATDEVEVEVTLPEVYYDPVYVAFANTQPLIAISYAARQDSPDGLGGILLYNTETGLTQDIPGVVSTLDMAFSPDDALLAYSSVEDGGTLILLDSTTLEEVRRVNVGSENFTNSLLFTPDGAGIIVAGGDGVLQRYEVATGALEATHLPTEEGLPITAAALSPDGTVLVIGTGDRDDVTPIAQGTIHFYDALTLTRRAFIADIHDYVATLAFSPDASLLISQGLRRVNVWAVEE